MTSYSRMTEFKINDNMIIECRVYDTGRTWGHTARVMVNDGGIFFEKTKVRTQYLNRTWEEWQYQSLLQQVAESKKLSENERLGVKLYLLHIKEGTEERPF